MEYFKRRGGVVFISYCRFWERHAFVQQSLVRQLIDEGIHVWWLDGEGWRPYRPTLYFNSPNLHVKQLFSLPLRRFSLIDGVSIKLQEGSLKRLLKEKPVVWVQAGMNEKLAERLPYIDVYSTFDDPYRHLREGALCKKAKLILCQNSFAQKLFEGEKKAQLAFPPIELLPISGKSDWTLPSKFLGKVMGYVGSFEYPGFDFELFEKFVNAFPDHAFLLSGRTDRQGLSFINNRLKGYPNFFYFPWRERGLLGPIWTQLNLTLLFYRPEKTQSGAFPIKVVESMHYGVPCIATRVKKTDDLQGWVKRGSNFDELCSLARGIFNSEDNQLKRAYHYFREATDPVRYLDRVGRLLNQLENRFGSEPRPPFSSESFSLDTNS